MWGVRKDSQTDSQKDPQKDPQRTHKGLNNVEKAAVLFGFRPNRTTPNNRTTGTVSAHTKGFTKDTKDSQKDSQRTHKGLTKDSQKDLQKDSQEGVKHVESSCFICCPLNFGEQTSVLSCFRSNIVKNIRSIGYPLTIGEHARVS